ncbi:hypothetical protein ACJJTC_003561 [Scirpophaga incertulas]
MVLLLIILCVANVLTSEVIPKKQYFPQDAEHHFDEFIRNFNKQYANEQEREVRFRIFKNNLVVINRRNAVDTAEHAVNQFSDLTTEEFQQYYGCIDMNSTKASSCTENIAKTSMNYSAPTSFDWRDKNKVTSVKAQGLCGSCWTFSVMGSVEGKYSMVHDDLKDFSEQQLVDCDPNSHGCHAKENGQCYYDPSKKAATVTGCYHHQFSDEEDLKQVLIDHGPLSVSINGDLLKTYRVGVLATCPYRNLNHAVLIVGYGMDGIVPYWIIKNSWSTNWGESGYVRIQMSQDHCAMSKDVFSADVA